MDDDSPLSPSDASHDFLSRSTPPTPSYLDDDSPLNPSDDRSGFLNRRLITPPREATVVAPKLPQIQTCPQGQLTLSAPVVSRWDAPPTVPSNSSRPRFPPGLPIPQSVQVASVAEHTLSQGPARLQNRIPRGPAWDIARPSQGQAPQVRSSQAWLHHGQNRVEHLELLLPWTWWRRIIWRMLGCWKGSTRTQQRNK